ncbi:MAG: hypothetical protein WD200_00610 [Candidatus Andersenbacteria bacterium]
MRYFIVALLSALVGWNLRTHRQQAPVWSGMPEPFLQGNNLPRPIQTHKDVRFVDGAFQFNALFLRGAEADRLPVIQIQLWDSLVSVETIYYTAVPYTTGVVLKLNCLLELPLTLRKHEVLKVELHHHETGPRTVKIFPACQEANYLAGMHIHE